MAGDGRTTGGLPIGSSPDRDLVDLALSVNHASLWSVRFDDAALSWGPGMDAVLGLDGAADSAVRSRLLELIEPVTLTARTAATWREFELEQQLEDAAGQQRAVAVRARRFGDQHGGGLVGIAADVSTVHRDRQELADLADRYRLLVELSPDGICVHQGGVIKYSNAAGLRMVGARSDEEVLGHPIEDFVSPASHPELHERVAQLTEPGATSPASEAELVSLTGDTVAVEAVSVRTTWQGQPAFQVILRDITAQKEAEHALHHRATHDELTGLLNRHGIRDTLDDLIRSNTGKPALLFCDIDNFKRVNDSLGHEAGDELLATLAVRMSSALPEGCTLARLSGDEFLIICPDADDAGGLGYLTRHFSDVLRTIVPVRNQLVSVSASTGAALLEGAMTGADLLRYADAAMFHAKSRGPGRVSLASADLITSVEGQLLLEQQLREAINHNALTLHYQPIVDRTGVVIMAEALVRWPHPDRGLLTPGSILPVAEQGNLLLELDRWVLRTALNEAATWPTSRGQDTTITVNLAGLQPGTGNFVADIATLIGSSGIDSRRVVLEMVETSLIDLPERSRQSMLELTARGVRFAIDDFGTGYSSLSRLKHLPAQIIKLDREFVSDIESNPADHAIARAVVEMSRAMGHTCVAEGVETRGQLDELDQLGIDAYQGYYFARPAPADQLRSRLHLRHL